MSAKLHVYAFTVEGFGGFPVDMLRYDECWPAFETDSGRLLDQHKTRRVELRGLRAPTTGRWKSFDWEIVVPAREVSA